MTAAVHLHHESMVQSLEETGDFRVLRKFKSHDLFNEDDGSVKKNLLVIDTETTGLDPQADKVIEIGFVLVEVNDNGKVFRVLERYNGMRDPGEPLSDQIKKITGITDADLAGKTFDLPCIDAAIARADIVVAQNAAFDRKFLEKDFKALEKKPWLCSLQQGPWEELNVSVRKQEFLAFQVAGIFYDAHRALTDSEVLLEILSCPGHQGKTILKSVMDKGSEPSFTIWAINSPFESKDELKSKGYRWADGTNESGFKSWYKEGVQDPDQELQYLEEKIYARESRIAIDLILPEDAYSGRYSERQMVQVKPRKPTAGMRP